MIINAISTDSPRYAQAVALIEQAGLPSEDLGNANVLLFGVIESNLLTGVIGLEALDNVGLMRSLVVEPGFRGQAFAQRLCEAVFRHAADRSMDALYLLTTDAADYFRRFDFEEIPRTEVPDCVRNSAQFSALCPAEAVVMQRTV